MQYQLYINGDRCKRANQTTSNNAVRCFNTVLTISQKIWKPRRENFADCCTIHTTCSIVVQQTSISLAFRSVVEASVCYQHITATYADHIKRDWFYYSRQQVLL